VNYDVLGLVGGAMAVKDVFYTAETYLVSRSKALLASLCDSAGDVASLMTIGIGGVQVARHGFGVFSALICLAVAAGSVLGTEVGLRLGKIMNSEKGTNSATSQPST
jgi:hypothetical protein